MLRSLRTRFLVVVIGIATLPILVLGLTAGQRSAAELERQSLALQLELASRVEREVASFVEARLNELRILERTNLLVAMDDEALSAALGRLLAHDQAYQALMVVDMDGRTRASVSRTDVELPGTEHERRMPFLESAYWRNQQQYVGSIDYDAALREPLLDIAIPIIERRTGNAIAALMAHVRFKRIWDLLAELELPDQTQAFVVSAAGRVLAHPSPAVVLSGSVFDLPEQSGRYPINGGRQGLVAKRELGHVGERVFVVVTRPLEAALAVASATRNTTLVTTTDAVAGCRCYWR